MNIEYAEKDFYPLVSIIIPVYNGTNYMQEAIDSALAQTYKNIEVLVINDGSKDNGKTEEIALLYKDKIRYFSKENGGVATALNLGIEEMKGEYFSWLSHDDIYPIDKVEKQINYLKRKINKNIVLYGNIRLINNQSQHIKDSRLQLSNPNEFVLRHLLESSLVNGCTLLIPKIIFSDIGLFNPALKSTQDYDMWFRMAQKYSFVCMDEILILSRQHEEQAVNIEKSTLKEEESNLFIYMLSNFTIENIEKLNEFEHPLFFYNHIARVFRRRKMKQVLILAENRIYKNLISPKVLINPRLLWKAIKNTWAYIYDCKIIDK